MTPFDDDKLSPAFAEHGRALLNSLQILLDSLQAAEEQSESLQLAESFSRESLEFQAYCEIGDLSEPALLIEQVRLLLSPAEAITSWDEAAVREWIVDAMTALHDYFTTLTGKKNLTEIRERKPNGSIDSSGNQLAALEAAFGGEQGSLPADRSDSERIEQCRSDEENVNSSEPSSERDTIEEEENVGEPERLSPDARHSEEEPATECELSDQSDIETALNEHGSEDDVDPLLEFLTAAAEHVQTMETLLMAVLATPDKASDSLGEITVHLVEIAALAEAVEFSEAEELAHALAVFVTGLQTGEVAATPDHHELLVTGHQTLSNLITGSVGREVLPPVMNQLAVALGMNDGPDTAGESAAEVKVETPEDAEWEIEFHDRDHISSELLEVFLEEAEEHLSRMHAALKQWEANPENQATLQEVRRAAHTMKGAAGAVGLTGVTRVSHRMEDLLDRMYESNQPLDAETVRVLFTTTDLLDDLIAGESDEDALRMTVQELSQDYTNLLSREERESTVIPDASTEPAPVTSLPAPEQQRFSVESVSVPPLASDTNSPQMVRVPLERLDALLRLVSEQMINRSSLEERIASVEHFANELQFTIERLQRLSHDFDSQFGVEFLGKSQLVSGMPMSWGTETDSVQETRLQEFDVLEFDQYTEFHLLNRSLAESTSDLSTIGQELNHLMTEFDTLLAQQQRLSGDVQNRLLQVRMVPLSRLASRLHRTVRMVAERQQKQISLVIQGEDVELDKVILEQMVDPLIHLLRNAADHGIEIPADRARQQKPTEAVICIEAEYQGTQVILRVTDDGRGISLDALRSRAVESGYLSANDVDRLNESELYQLLFLPGFSTATQVSEISGRGVGMDIVRDQVHKLNGTIAIESTPRIGTTITVRLPMSLALMKTLFVQTGDATFAIPMQAVTRVVRMTTNEVERFGDRNFLRLGDDAVPVLILSEHLGLGKDNFPEDHRPALVVHTDDGLVAIAVDRIVSTSDVVVKPLGNHLRHVPGLIGATLQGDGKVVPILNTAQLMEQSATVSPTIRQEPTVEPSAALRVMIVDDSVSVRRVMSKTVEQAGWEPLVAKDGLDALAFLDEEFEAAPDIVLLDIEMPRMDGYELLSRLRSDPRHADTPVIMVTSRASQKHRDKAMQLGATAFLVKPYQEDTLLQLIVDLTRKDVTVSES